MEQQLDLSDFEQATVTSSNSQLETVQPFTIEESPPMDAESGRLLQQDSNTLICSSLRRSPPLAATAGTASVATAAEAAIKAPRREKHYKDKSWTNSNQVSHNRDVVVSSDDRGTYSFSSTPSSTSSSTTSSSTSAEGAAVSIGDRSVSAGEADLAGNDFATNQSAKSPATFASGGSSSGSSCSSSGGSDSDCSNSENNSHNSESSGSSGGGGGGGGVGGGRGFVCSNSNLVSDALEESEAEGSLQETPSDGHDEEDSAPAMRSTDEENDTSATDGPSTDAGDDTGAESTESNTGEQTDSVFANLGETTEAEATMLTDGNAEKAAAPRQSVTRLNKNEIANLIEKAILDFCSSRTVETMRRMFAGVTNDSEALLRDGGRHDDKSASTPHPVTGELVKEGVIIGDIDVFAPRMQREFILPVKDSLIATFLREPGVFRAICYRTRCQVEVTRRLLNRKLCIGGRWHKYMIIRIVGPTYKSIENCDTLLQKAVPSYKLRKVYNTAAVCRMFLREDVPDNAELYYSYQRTGGSSQRYGALKLESPYRQTALRTSGNSPWKYGLFKVGKLAFSAPAVKMCMKHVYPSQGYQTTTSLEREYQGVNATERIVALHDQFQVNRQSAITLKRALTIPVCR